MSTNRVNIPRSIQDVHYRYTMVVMDTQISGSGNGINTKIKNLEEIARDLRRDITHLMKFYSLELGTIISNKRGQYVLNGKFSNKRLTNILDKLIDKFILCRKCSNPETDFKLKKQSLYLDCKSCGHQTIINHNSKFIDFYSKTLKKIL